MRVLISAEKEVLRLAWAQGKPVGPKDVADYFGVNHRTARKWLQALVEKGCMNPISRGRQVRYYELKEGQLLEQLR